MTTKKTYRGGNPNAQNIMIETLDQVRKAKQELRTLTRQRYFSEREHARYIPVYTAILRQPHEAQTRAAREHAIQVAGNHLDRLKEINDRHQHAVDLAQEYLTAAREAYAASRAYIRAMRGADQDNIHRALYERDTKIQLANAARFLLHKLRNDGGGYYSNTTNGNSNSAGSAGSRGSRGSRH